VSALALALHMLLFVPSCLSPPSYLCSFVCSGGQFNERNASLACSLLSASMQYTVIFCCCSENKFWLIRWLIDWLIDWLTCAENRYLNDTSWGNTSDTQRRVYFVSVRSRAAMISGVLVICSIPLTGTTWSPTLKVPSRFYTGFYEDGFWYHLCVDVCAR